MESKFKLWVIFLLFGAYRVENSSTLGKRGGLVFLILSWHVCA